MVGLLARGLKVKWEYENISKRASPHLLQSMFYNAPIDMAGGLNG
jgi:hypothetical protein